MTTGRAARIVRANGFFRKINDDGVWRRHLSTGKTTTTPVVHVRVIIIMFLSLDTVWNLLTAFTNYISAATSQVLHSIVTIFYWAYAEEHEPSYPYRRENGRVQPKSSRRTGKILPFAVPSGLTPYVP